MIVSLLESNGRDALMLDRELADAALQRVSLLSFPESGYPCNCRDHAAGVGICPHQASVPTK